MERRGAVNTRPYGGISGVVGRVATLDFTAGHGITTGRAVLEPTPTFLLSIDGDRSPAFVADSARATDSGQRRSLRAFGRVAPTLLRRRVALEIAAIPLHRCMQGRNQLMLRPPIEMRLGAHAIKFLLGTLALREVLTDRLDIFPIAGAREQTRHLQKGHRATAAGGESTLRLAVRRRGGGGARSATCSGEELFFGFGSNPKRVGHRAASLARIRARTSAHSGAGWARATAARSRRSSSACHAASHPESGGPSTLAISSAARSRRSSSGRARAASRSFVDAPLTVGA